MGVFSGRRRIMKLVVRYSPEAYPPDRCWTSEVTDGWRKFQVWRPTYPEVMEAGLEDLEALAAGRIG